MYVLNFFDSRNAIRYINIAFMYKLMTFRNQELAIWLVVFYIQSKEKSPAVQKHPIPRDCGSFVVNKTPASDTTPPYIFSRSPIAFLTYSTLPNKLVNMPKHFKMPPGSPQYLKDLPNNLCIEPYPTSNLERRLALANKPMPTKKTLTPIQRPSSARPNPRKSPRPSNNIPIGATSS